MSEKKKKERNRATFRKILQYISKNKLLLAVSLFFALLTVAGSLFLPILFGEAVDVIVGENQVAFEQVMNLIVIGIVVIVVTAVSQFLMNLCNNRMVGNVVERMRKDAIRKVQRLPIGYIDRRSTGEMISCIISDVEVFSEGLLMGFTQLFTGVLTILGTLVFMLTIDVRVTVIVVLVTPLSFFVASFVSKKSRMRNSRNSRAFQNIYQLIWIFVCGYRFRCKKYYSCRTWRGRRNNSHHGHRIILLCQEWCATFTHRRIRLSL